MKELLQRWAAVEPERCQLVPETYDEDILCPAYYEVFIDGCALPADGLLGHEQIATQEAIEARGWKWGRSPIGETFHVVIPNEGFATDYWEWVEGHDTLLEAYLAALETLKEEV